MLKRTKKSWILSLDFPLFIKDKEVKKVIFSNVYSLSDIKKIMEKGVFEYLEECFSSDPSFLWGRFFKLV
jgi:hypothetical protein